MFALLIVIHIIACFVLILVILLQTGRGTGINESFGLSSTQTIFGTRATTFLTRATSACAVVYLLTCLGLALLSSHRSRSLMERRLMQQGARQAVPGAPVVPGAPTAPAAAGAQAAPTAPTAQDVPGVPAKTIPAIPEAPIESE